MPREATAYCPSGLQLLVRSRTGKDYDVLADLDSDPHGVMGRYMEGVTLRTVERGIAYDDRQFYPDGRPIYNDDFLIGDFFYLTMFHFELCSPNKPFEFEWRCSEKLHSSKPRGIFSDNTCKGRETVRVKLGDADSDGRKGEDGIYLLPVLPLSQDDADAFRNGNRLEESLHGTKIYIQLATRGSARKSARRAAKEESREEKFTSVAAGRILEVEGVGNTFDKIRAWAGSLDDDDISDLLDVLDKHDCGVDGFVEIECPGACARDHVVEVEINDTDFLAERRERRRRLRMR